MLPPLRGSRACLAASSQRPSAGNLVRYWQDEFSGKKIDESEARSFIRENISSFDFSEVVPPGPRQFMNFAVHSKNSRPGKNGIPYSAYANIDCSSILYECFLWLASGKMLLINSNDLILAWAPKGRLPEDSIEITRHPRSTRPIGLRNADNTIINWTLNQH